MKRKIYSQYCYGVPVECPSCKADLDGGSIPEAHHKYYSPPYRWRRTIAIYDYEKDRTVAWGCPDCEHEWAA